MEAPIFLNFIREACFSGLDEEDYDFVTLSRADHASPKSRARTASSAGKSGPLNK